MTLLVGHQMANRRGEPIDGHQVLALVPLEPQQIDEPRVHLLGRDLAGNRIGKLQWQVEAVVYPVCESPIMLDGR